MTLDEFNAFCGALPGTSRVIQWGGAHVWKVGDKVFAIASFWGEDRPDGDHKITVKCSDIGWEVLKDQPPFVPAPYLARGKWVQCEAPDEVDRTELEELITTSCAIIAGQLTVKKRAELGIEPLE